MSTELNGRAELADDWMARGLGPDTEWLRAHYWSGPPLEYARLREIAAQMSIDTGSVLTLDAPDGEHLDPRWKGYSVRLWFLPSDRVGVQSSACPWRLLSNGRMEYAYPNASWPAPLAAVQPPVVLRIHLWRPSESGFIEGYWSPATSGTTPKSRDPHNAGEARWSLCDLDEHTTSKAFKAWVALFRQHAQKGRPDGTSTYPEKAAFEARVREVIADLRRQGLTADEYAVSEALSIAKRTLQERLHDFGLEWTRDFKSR